MSVGIYVPPVITVSHDLDEGVYRLYATSYHSTEPAGERLFRAEPWPVIKFEHATEAAAEKDAAVLRAYLADCASGKKKDKAPAVRVSNNYWME